jgi:DNA-directed RNA polymerase alpha subunit
VELCSRKIAEKADEGTDMNGRNIAHGSAETFVAPIVPMADDRSPMAWKEDSRIDFRMLSPRLANVLARNGIFRIEDILKLSRLEMMALPGFGKKCLADLQNYLSAKGILLPEQRADGSRAADPGITVLIHDNR